MAELITIPRYQYIKLVNENRMLKKTELYKRLLEFEQNIQAGKVFTRKDLGF